MIGQGLPPHGATVKDEHGHEHTDMSVEPMFSRFFAFIGLFAFGMYTLVVSDNLLTLFVGWEIMGLCSYLLIGFWYAKTFGSGSCNQGFHDDPGWRCVHAARNCLPLHRYRHTELPGDFYNPEVLHVLGNTYTPAWNFCRECHCHPDLHRHHWKIRTMAAACLVAGCDGRSHTCFSDDSCCNHGVSRCLSRHPDLSFGLGRWRSPQLDTSHDDHGDHRLVSPPFSLRQSQSPRMTLKKSSLIRPSHSLGS